MKVSEIVNGETDPDLIIEILKQRDGEHPDISAIKNALDPKEHEISDKIKRPDKPVYEFSDTGAATATNSPYNAPKSTKSEKTFSGKVEKVNRIALSLQSLIVNRAVSFSVGNPLIRTFSGDLNKDFETVKKGLERVYKDNDETTINKKVARLIYSGAEAAEYWFPKVTDEEHDKYGFKTKVKMKCVVFDTLKGTKLYPIKDIYGDMIGISREFTLKKGRDTVNYFEVFTDEEIILFTQEGGAGWAQGATRPTLNKKIPVIFGCQEKPDFETVNGIIDRLELLLSNFAEINDYNAAPKHYVKGKILTWGQKGAANTVIQGEANTEYKILSWDHAPESVKNEVEVLLKFIFTLTQTPDISFDNLKSLGNISGVALKLLFMDAHLKVMDKEEVLNQYFRRRDQVVLSYLAVLNPGLSDAYKTVDIDRKLDPFMIADEKEQAELTMILNGDQPVRSQETSVSEWGGDSSEFQRIKDEAKVRNTALVTEPTDL